MKPIDFTKINLLTKIIDEIAEDVDATKRMTNSVHDISFELL